MEGLLNIFRRDGKRRAARSGRVKTARQRRESIRSHVEALERRSMLAVTVNEPTPGELLILYNQPDPNTNITATTNQHVTVEIENIGGPVEITRVNVYTASNPTAQVFTNIGLITVTVPNYDSPGVNSNSLTIKGINLKGGSDRIIMTGAGRTAAGRWSDQDQAVENQVLLEIAGIDDLTLTAGGIINVSGAYTNDTNDASIKAFGTEPEDYTQQYNATVVVAETTPVPGTLPQPGLFSNFIEIVGGELDILGDIAATDHVILRAGEKTDVGQSLVLPYDVTVTGSVVTPTPGRLELYSTKNIVQLQGSTLTASHLVAVSNDADVDQPAGPWMIDLGSENNDFDTIALGMVSAPGDTPTVATEGRIGVRDKDDLTVSDFGILAATGQVRIDAAGALTFAAPIQATGLIGESDHSITSTDGAIMRLGVLGLELYANDSFDDTATGDITLRGPIIIDQVDAAGVRATTLVSNKIQATGNTTIVGGIYSPLAGTTTITSNLGILVDGPIQVGSTQLNADSTVPTCYDHDLMLISHFGAITVNDRPGGDAVPRTIQATNIVSFDALETITIGGSVYAGTEYGNALALPESDALPAITIIGDADVIVTATGSLETQAYENNADLYSNPLLGRISIDATTQFDLQGWIKADGPLDVTSNGDVYLYGPITTRESIDVETRQGSIDVQGALRTTGWIYTTTPPAPLLEQRTPDIILSAPQGGITTSVLGTISAGTMSVAGVDAYGTVILESSQDIVIRADIDTDGEFQGTSKMGSFQLGALLRTGRDLVPNADIAATISAYGGIIGGILPLDPDDPGSEFGQIQTERLDITVTSFDLLTPADIILTGPGNRIDRLLVRNFSPSGSTTIVNDTVYDAVTNGPVLDLSLVDVVGDFSLTSNSTIAIDGMAQSTQGDIKVIAESGGINVQSTVRAPGGAVTLTASGQIVQRGGSVTTLYLLSGGRNYTYAIITVDPPPGAGDRALVSATITPYPSPPPDTNKGDGVTGFISALTLLNGGWGYPSGSRVGITIEGDGDGAAAVAETTIMTSSIEAKNDVKLTGGDGITLVSAVRSVDGSVAMTATLGDVSVESITAGNKVDVNANRGKVALVSVQATNDVTLDADQGVRVTGTVGSTAGNIALDTTNGDLLMPSDAIAGDVPEPTLYAKAGAITLTSQNGAADVRNLNAGTKVAVTSFKSMTLSGEIASQTADIEALSTSGGIFLDANVVAERGKILLESQTFLLQGDATGIQTVQVIDAGSVVQAAGTVAPTVTVEIAPPTAGGTQATAEAVLAKRAIGTGGQDEWYIASIRITNPGSGYALGETPITTVIGMGQAIAQAIGPTNLRNLSAETGIEIKAGNDVTLLYEASAKNGGVTISSLTGDLVLGAPDVLLQALGGSVQLTADCGSVTVERICADENIDIDGETGVSVERIADAGGAITLTAGVGNVSLAGEVTAKMGAVTVKSTSGGILLSANINAMQDAVKLTAHGGVSQTSGSGLQQIRVLSGGESADVVIPTVTVTVAAPAAGGVAATAYANLVSFTNLNGDTRWKISSITILNPGRGYAIGESPTVTITTQPEDQLPGAAALAIGPAGYQDIVANKDVAIAAGETVNLVNTVRSNIGEISISSTDGDLQLGTEGFFAHALMGSVSLDSDCGEVVVQRVCANKGGIDISGETGVSVLTSLDADGDITLSAGIGAVQINGEVESLAGDIKASSTSGDVRLAANVHAVEGKILITAHNGVNQVVGTGLSSVQVLFGGESEDAVVPTVTVSIESPIGGGESARGYAVLESFRNLNGALRYRVASIVLTSYGNGYGVGEVPRVTITGVVGAAAIAVGPTGYQNIVAKQNLVITAGSAVVLSNTVRSDAGPLSVTSAGGDITSTGDLQASVGVVTLTSDCGNVSVLDVCAGDDVKITAESSLTVGRQVTSDAGDISLASDAGTVFLKGSLNATTGAIDIKANQGVIQTDSSGITSIRIVTPGSLAATQQPIVTVNIATPAAGGVAATASAIVSQIGTRELPGIADPVPVWGVTEIIITNPGSGYAVGENPLVTVTGVTGVVAVATGPTAFANITAASDVSIAGGDDVTLVNAVRSSAGDITITAATGDIDLTAVGFVAHAAGNVTLDSLCGMVSAKDVCAGEDVAISAEATVRLFDEVSSDAGDISVTSRSGTVFLSANLHADGGAIAVVAHGGVNQSATSGLRRVNVIYGGQFIGDVPPNVTVTIAAPAAGGLAATAIATVSQVGTDNTGTPIFAVTAITLTNPGVGYVLDEVPTVEVQGINGVTAVAVGPDGYQNIVAETNVSISGGDAVTLVNTVRAKTGDVDIASTAGDLDLGAATLLVVADQGDVTLSAARGAADIQQVHAGQTISVAASLATSIVNLFAGDDVTVNAGGTITLHGVIDSDAGDISLTSRNRDLDFTPSGAELHALQGGVALAALNGTIMSPPTLHASKDVTLTSFNTLVLNNEITSDTGIIDLKSTSGSINLGANLDARDDSIRLNAKGSVTQIGGGIGYVSVLNGGTGYTAAATVTIAGPSSGTGVAARAMPIIGTVKGVSGVIIGIRLTNPGSGYGAGEQPVVTFTRNATPPAGVTWIDASAMAVASPALGNSGLAAIDVTAGGSGYDATTTVTMAAPTDLAGNPVPGGRAATAQAVIGSVTVDGVTTDGVILDIVILDPGSGYGAGERPVVTITGNGTGAVARAIANITLQDIRAGQDIDIYAGTGVLLLNTVRADQGHVTITSETGNVNLAARTLLVSSFADDIEITARRGAINVQRLAADGDITLKAQIGVTLLNAVNSTGEFGTGDVSIYTVNGNIAAVAPNGLISVQNGGVSLESVNGTIIVPNVFNVVGDISLKTYGSQTINQTLTSATGSITVASATGSVTLAANVFADERVTLSAKTGISQTKGFMQGQELVARNASTSAVNLTNAGNDFANVSIMSLGSVSYVDANDFETGVERDPYSGNPLGVEVMGDALALSSVAPYSHIRVVSGLRYRTLSIAAGTLSGTTVGYVDYVITSGGDNPQANAAFQGTLRDMIRYSNDNSAQYARETTLTPQPQAMVFDEFGYTVEEVKLGAALPAFLRPVLFDGGQLEEAATVDRVGIAGNAAIAYGLAFSPAVAAVPGKSPAYPGSAGSTIQHVAAYGFTKGSAIVLASGNNTVLDLHAGLKADGTVPGNFIGLDVSGAAAVNNQVGAAVFDPEAVNRFGGNASAGILIRNGANGTRVYGSVIGDDTGATPELANGDGIRISNATRNWIGTPDEVQVDLTPSRSNLIMGNKFAGVQISGSVAGTLAAANAVRNNYIAGNGTGVGIAASKFAVLGGIDGRSANVIVGQLGNGVGVADSTNVQIQGNRVGIVPAFGFDAEAVLGNAGDGIAITGKSSAVEISEANWIGGNQANGVSIGTGVTGVTLTGNTIGGALADGTASGNARDGVAITAAIGNAVGIGNTISSNLRHGVSITDARSATLLAGNRVFGSTVTANGGSGILISGGSASTIGGTTAGTGNVITANAGNGIRVETSAKTGAATGHAIQGNWIGTNENAEVDATLGNAESGISLDGAINAVVGNGNVVMNNAGNGIDVVNGSGSTIGAATLAAGNLITDNAGNGVSVSGRATGITIMGNTIAAQGGDGVNIAAGVRGVRIGQTVTQKAVTGAGNVIHDNAGWGVQVGAAAQQIGVQGNSFYDNALGAMTLGAGANAVAPTTVTLSSVIMRTASGGSRQLVLSGSLVGTGIRARQQYSVDVYANPADSADPQARRYLGRFTVTATVNGRVNFSNMTITANVAVDEQITATATSLVFDPGSTSRFSGAVRARLR